MKKLINKIIGLSGYQIKNKKYLYETDKNLIKSINHFNINSILDVGANKGQFALKLIENGFKGDILSFEPLSLEHKKLVEYSQKIGNWHIAKKCALGNKNSKKKFYITGNRESSSLLKILPKHTQLRPDSRIIATEVVEIKKLENFKKQIKKYKKNLLLKIDTQGSEIDVLSGSGKMINDLKCLFIEVSLVHLYENQTLWLDIIKYLKDFKFEVWSVDQLLRNNKTGQTYQLDIFFYRNT